MQLRPLILREHYYSPVEAEIQRLFDDLIYKPLIEACGKPFEELKNAINALVTAIAMGEVWYDNGLFKGSYDSEISRELRRIGAFYNPTSRTWALPRDKLPAEISIAIARSESIYEKTRNRFLAALDSINPEAVEQDSKTVEKYQNTIDIFENEFQRIIDPIEAISITPVITPQQRDLIAQDWGQNLNKYIKDWTADNIIELREGVQIHGLAGGRAEGLVKMLQDNYGVSTRKAKFLARQETSLLMSKFQESRYKTIGITKYKWSGANDERERPDHKALNGRIFSWSDPPITNRETGARNHPGEDFGCRCTAIPWLD